MTESPTLVRGRVGLAATCCGVMFFYAVYLGAISVLLPFIGKTFHLGAEAQGRLFPADFIGFVSGVLLCGVLSDRYGRKRILLSGIFSYALGLLIFGCARTFAFALAASFLVGAGSGAMEAVASALATDLYPDKRAFIINTIQVAFGAGAASSPALARLLLTAGWDWKLLYLGLAAANVALFLVLLSQPVPNSTGAESKFDFSALKYLLKQRVFILLCAAEAIYVGAETGFFSWMPTYFEKEITGGVEFAGLVVTVFWIAITVGRFLTGFLIDRFDLMGLTLTLCICSAVTSSLSLAWKQPILVMFMVMLTGLGFSGIFGLILAEAGEQYHDISGSVFGGVVAAGGVGGAVFPWMVGAAASAGAGWRAALGTVPILCIILAGLTIFLRQNQEEQRLNG